jgi:adenosine 3'-phospho 5'-phosphosulfate transporter B2
MLSESMQSALWCLCYGSGIIGMLLVYGVIQERIMSEPYDGEFFRTSVFLVLCNRLVAICYAISMAALKGEEFKNKAPLVKYLMVSFSNVAATWCQYEALKYVSFPVQMLGKSFKMMPVMMWGIIISQKKYKLIDWLIAFGVTAGVTQFLLTGSISAKYANKGTSVYGLLLLVAFLACDGFTSTFQEKLFREHKTSKYNQMMYVNGGSAVVSASTLLASGGAPKAIAFCFKHPDFVMHAGSLSFAAVAGQFFIYSQVKEFGALVLAATMNTRQVISILVSYIMYSHPISLLQVVGLFIVFSTLFYKSYRGYTAPKEDKPPKKPRVESAVDDDPPPNKDLESPQKTAPEPEWVGKPDPQEPDEPDSDEIGDQKVGNNDWK